MTQLPKIVSARLSGVGNSDHPDADLLTALTEGALNGRERDRVLNHVSSCLECRQVVALALPEPSTDAESSPVAGRTPWWRIPVLRWSALAACLVAVAATVLVHKREESSHNEVQLAMEHGPMPAPAVQARAPAQAAPARAVSRPEAKAKARRSPAPDAQATPREMASANAPATPPKAPGSGNTAESDLMQRSESVEVQAQALSRESEPPARADQDLRARNSVAVAKAAPSFMARPTPETAASTIGGAAKLADLRAPSWRLSKDGLPERSFGSGQWETVQVDHKTGFRAVAALGMEVWIGGPGGLLYHSDDMGLNWTRIIPVSSSATLTDDVTAIAFADHLHGSVATAGGQTWVTSDAGKTWEMR